MAILLASCGHREEVKRRPASLLNKDSTCSAMFKKFLKIQGVKDSSFLKRRNVFKKVSDKFKIEYEKTDFESLKKFDANIKTIGDPVESLAARIASIRNAKSSIDLTTYVFSNDEVGYLFLNELKKAIERGVSVRLIYDSVGTTLAGGHSFSNNAFKALQAVRPGLIKNTEGVETLKRATIEIASFNSIANLHLYIRRWLNKLRNLFRSSENKLPISNYKINHRLHDKMMIIDIGNENSYGFFGGRNIANEYYAQADKTMNFDDFDIMIKLDDPTSSNLELSGLLMEYVDRLYFHVGNSYLEKTFFKLSSKSKKKEIIKMAHAKPKLTVNIDQEVQRVNDSDFFNNALNKSSVQFVHELNNLIGLTKKEKKFYSSSIIENLHADIKQAKKKITILTPYINLKEKDLELLKTWLEESPDRKLEIITNSIYSNNHNIVQALLDNISLPRVHRKLKEYINSGQVDILLYYDVKKKNIIETEKLDPVKLFLGKKKKYIVEHPKLHTKLISIDDDKAYVMSFNFNGRSSYLDTESGFKIFKSEEQDASISSIQSYIAHMRKNTVTFQSYEWAKLYENPEMKGKAQLHAFLAYFISLFKIEGSL